MLAPLFFHFPEGDVSIALGLKDSMDNTLYYKLRTPQAGLRRDVEGYFVPETMKINEANGLLTWDGKINGQLVHGALAVAVHVYQYHNGKRIGLLGAGLSNYGGERLDSAGTRCKASAGRKQIASPRQQRRNFPQNNIALRQS